jgi:predicted amidohydrolase
MRVAVIQLSAIGISSDSLRAYMRSCVAEDVSVVLLGEYVLNRFFKELHKMPLEMIKKQSDHHLEALKEMAKEFDLDIIAPLIIVKAKKLYKSIVRFTPKRTHFYQQQILINYSHWNEEQFFDNEIAPLKEPMTFKVGKYRVGVMAGFEAHFDPFWETMSDKAVDIVLIPTLSTFASHKRWRQLFSMRAFTHSCYIVRANRVGDYEDDEDDVKWEFYGDSLAYTPQGELLQHLGNYEEVLIVEIDKDALKEAKTWGFREALKKRNALTSKDKS